MTTPVVSSWATFMEGVLGNLGVPPQYWSTDVPELIGWASREHSSAYPGGGVDQGGAYNPLNVAYDPVAGSSLYNDLGGGGGVEDFPSSEVGEAQTAQRLQNGDYSAILSDLMQGKPWSGDPATQSEFLKWSGNAYSNPGDSQSIDQGGVAASTPAPSSSPATGDASPANQAGQFLGSGAATALGSMLGSPTSGTGIWGWAVPRLPALLVAAVFAYMLFGRDVTSVDASA